MTDITIRNIPEDVAEKLAAQAARRGISREALIRQVLAGTASTEYTPSRFQEGYKIFTESGGKASVIYGNGYVMGGATNLTQPEMEAYQRAKMLADPKNGGKWAEARQVLEAAGFEVFNV